MAPGAEPQGDLWASPAYVRQPCQADAIQPAALPSGVFFITFYFFLA